MSRAYATPLRLEISPSLNWLIFYLIVLIFCSLSIVLAALPLLIKGLLFLCVLFILWRSYNLQKQIISIVWQHENDWLIIQGDESEYAVLLKGSFHSRYLVILSFKLQSKKTKSVAFTPADVCSKNYRQLRVRLIVEAEKMLNKKPTINI